MDQVGVLGRDRRGGDPLDVLFVAHHPGVGQAEVGGSQRADQHPHRAQASGLDGAVDAQAGRRAVTVLGPEASLDRLVEEHDTAPRPFPGGAQLVEVADADHLRHETAGRGGNAAAQAEQRQVVARRRHDRAGLVAADPGRDDDLLGADLVDAVPAELFHRPGDRLVQLLRAGQPVADAVGEPGQLVPDLAVDQGGGGDTPGRLIDRDRGALGRGLTGGSGLREDGRPAGKKQRHASQCKDSHGRHYLQNRAWRHGRPSLNSTITTK